MEHCRAHLVPRQMESTNHDHHQREMVSCKNWIAEEWMGAFCYRHAREVQGVSLCARVGLCFRAFLFSLQDAQWSCLDTITITSHCLETSRVSLLQQLQVINWAPTAWFQYSFAASVTTKLLFSIFFFFNMKYIY